jgi:hypothetical protein
MRYFKPKETERNINAVEIKMVSAIEKLIFNVIESEENRVADRNDSGLPPPKPKPPGSILF